MPQPRTIGAWPSAGERRTHCILQYAVPTTDAMGGRSEPTWTEFGRWWAKVNTVPDVRGETESVISYQAEGLYRADLFEYFHGISRPAGLAAGLTVSMRIVANHVTLKVFQVENPLLQSRTLIVHCAPATVTQ